MRIGVAVILCVPFLAVAPARGAELVVTPGTLAFVGVKEGATPAAQTLEIGTAPDNGLAWTASETLPWLAVSVSDGVTPATIDVTTSDFASLNTGAYKGEITLSAPGATGSPRTVNVTLDVLETASLVVKPSSLKFDVVEGSEGAFGAGVQLLYPYTDVAWTATTNATWLAVSPAAGTTPSLPSITPNVGTLTPGTYQGTVTFAEAVTGTTAVVTVEIVVQQAAGAACADDAWACVRFDDLTLGSINGQAGWISNDAVAEGHVAADPRGVGNVLLLDPPAGETSVDHVVLNDQPIDLTEVSLQVRLNNLPPDKRQVGKLEFYTSDNAWGKTGRTFGAIRMAGGVLYFQYGANTYTKIVDGAISDRFYDIKVRFRDDEIQVLVDGVVRFTTTNPVPGTQSVQAFVATGWGAPGSASIDMLQARALPAVQQAELVVDPEVLNFAGVQMAAGNAAENGAAYASAAAGTIPMAFEPNVGQAEGKAKFVARGAGYAVQIRSDGADLNLAADRAVALRLLGAQAAEPTGEETLPGKSHYLVGQDRSRWKRGIPHFGRVRSRQVYPGIDAVFYGNQRRLEYDFEVAPGADPSSIRMSFAGAQGLHLDPRGDLILSTPGGDLRQHKPIAYQPAGSRHDPVDAGYVVHDDGAVSVRVASYDPARPLVIDPVLSYSTKLGGSANDHAAAIAVDAQGNTYIAGHTASIDLPTATMIQLSKGGGTDAFVTKLNPCGTAVLYSTYLGGAANDQAMDLAVDASGAVYVVGVTESTNFPTLDALQATESGPGPDAFVARLEPDGADLGFSTYLAAAAGGGSTWASGVQVHGGKLIVGGATTASTLAGVSPAPVNAFVTTGPVSPFVGRLLLDGQALEGLVYLNSDCAVDVSTTLPQLAVDAFGNVVVSGTITGCSGLPLDRVRNPFPISTSGWLSAHGDAGVFVTKLDASSLDSVLYSSLFGGSGTELARAVTVGPDGAAYVAGSVGPPGADAVEFPTTSGAVWTTHSGTGADGFLVKLRPDGTGAEYSTHLGREAASDVMRGVEVDSTGRAYVVGNSRWDSFPAGKCVNKANHGGQTAMAVLVKVDPTGGILEDCLFLGPGGVARGVALDAAGSVYVTGSGAPNTFVTTPGAFQSTGTDEAFVTKLSNTPPGATALLQFSHSQYGVAENAGQATVTVTRTGATHDAVSVLYATADGTAEPLDYTGVGNILTFNPGEESQTFAVPILDDGDVEGTETVRLTLSSPTQCAGLAARKTAILSIVDNDNTSPSGLTRTFVIRDRYLAEGPAWSATITDAPWLTLSALSGTAPSTVTATARTGLAAGSYKGTITITSPGVAGSPRTIQVKLVVSAP